jgi:hypothetical protein
MRRREFICALAGTTAWPLGLHAQEVGKLPGSVTTIMMSAT